MMMLSGRHWPVHPHPLPDELLTSWLVRLAHANGLKVQTFCQHEFGLAHQVWNRDVDRLAPDWLVHRLAAGAGLPLDTVLATSLQSYQGMLFHHFPLSGQLRWILPLQLYHRKRQGYGLQYCPCCLADDAEPYFRRAWRVALHTFCPTHGVLLQDRCPSCGSGVAFHRLELGHPQQTQVDSLSRCSVCGFDFRLTVTPVVEPWDRRVFAAWRAVLHRIDAGKEMPHRLADGTLDVLHHVCVLQVSRRLALKLHPYLCRQTGQPERVLTAGRLPFEQRPLVERHHLISLAWWLLDRWPARLQRAWEGGAVRYNVLLKDFDDAPKWYSQMALSLLSASGQDRQDA